tara:strand:+ start:531 stop:635 length:105 start_codon:yes stop_codon:yes gene_type:complete
MDQQIHKTMQEVVVVLVNQIHNLLLATNQEIQVV